ncbi:MAG: HAD hydrolase-like protein [Xanthomonadales bacterium]|nr:HAD hydrolase-like protein [Xanthomonadales bacterium]
MSPVRNRPCAFFDLDGTLTNPQVGIVNCIEYAFERLGLTAPERETLTTWIGPPLQESFQQFLGDRNLASQALGFYRERFSSRGLLENEIIPGMGELLETLSSRGVECSVVTSKPRVFARRIVEHFGLNPWLTQVIGSELDGTRGDKTELIRYALEQIGRRAADTIMLGDRHHDITGARNNGVASIGVTWGFGSITELREAGADAIVNEVPRLMDYWDLAETAGVN